MQREISQLNPGDTVSIRIYAEGKFRTATLKVARSGDLPRGQRGMTYFGGDGAMHGMRMMPPMPPMPAMAPRVPRPPMPMMDDMRYNMGPEIRRSVEQSIEGLRMRLEDIRPQLDRIEPRVRMELDDMRPEIDRIEPRVRMELERIRPELDRLRMEMPRLLDQVRSSRIRMVDYID